MSDADTGGAEASQQWDGSTIPPRDIDWSGYGLGGGAPRTPAPEPPRLDAVPDEPPARAPLYRRVLAMLLTALLVAWVLDAVWAVIAFTVNVGDDPARAIGILGFVPIVFRALVTTVVLWLAWMWARPPARE